MSGNQDSIGLLATLPDGARVVSALLTDQVPYQHVYRVVSKSGAVVVEFLTLVQLSDFVAQYVLQIPSASQRLEA